MKRNLSNNLHTNDFENNLALLAYFRNKGVYKLFTTIYDKTQKQLEISPKRNQHYFFNSYQLENEYNQFVQQTAQTTKRFSEYKNVSHITVLDKFYALSKLKQICNELNFQQTFQQESTIVLKNEVIELIENNDALKNEPAIAVYYYIYKTLIDAENQQHFSELKQRISENSEAFSQPEAREVYIFAQNYCIRKVNKGNSEFLTTLFELYKESIAQKHYLSKS